MFWTDHGSTPSVKKANMDGSSVTEIVTQNITWPNGIAIDYSGNSTAYLTIKVMARRHIKHTLTPP